MIDSRFRPYAREQLLRLYSRGVILQSDNRLTLFRTAS
jgi:hypothetical protein